MIKIKIENKTFWGIYNWDDITIQQFADLAAIPMPDGYESFILADGKFSMEDLNKYVESVSSITDKQLNEDFPEYYRKVIACLSNIPISLLNKVPNELIEKRYDYYFKPFVVSILYHAPVIHFMGQIKPYETKQFKSFRLGLQKFYLPETVTIMEQEITLAKEPVITYVEACGMIRGLKFTKEDINRLAWFMGIYCRKKNERYGEQNVIERQAMFMKTPMSIVWSVFFYTLRRLPDSSLIILLFGSLPKTMTETVSGAKIYRDMAALDSSMKHVDTAVLGH
jgi:hypothetical protein